jgi:predicted nuclease of predicted toxin-antitoxin system
MKLLLDMNLSPAWVPVLQQEGWQTSHWASVGPINAPDTEIMR